MLKRITLLPVLLVALALAGCSKKTDDPTPTTPTLSAKATLLTTPRWRISGIVTVGNFNGQIITNNPALPLCNQDDFSKFNPNLSVVVDAGTVKCAPADPQTKTATWSFNAAETQLTTVDPSQPVGSQGHTITADLLQLTGTTLVVRTNNTQVLGGITVVSTATTTYMAF